MRLGLNLGYWGSSADRENVALAVEAERLGYSVIWAAEAYGSDSPTVLSYIAAHTDTIDLGSAAMQIPARSAATTAMTAATLDLLSGGRFRLGLGVSGPQVSEGWHGVRFDQPLGRSREYTAIVRSVLRRERVTFDGEHFTLPLPEGPGKPLRLTVHPAREHIPIYLAAVGPRNCALAGEIADGWLGIFFAPEHAEMMLDPLREGRTRVGADLAGFDVATSVAVSLGADVETSAEPLRDQAALYVGGMGSREQNFYNRLAVRMGFGEQAERVQQLYLERRPRDAAAAVPLGFLEQTALLGPRERVRDRLQAYADVGVTTLNLMLPPDSIEQRVQTLRTVSEAAAAAGV
ncbi:MAG TPA: LLM class F420-dependent oxidoreductase [Jiangellaceae bacterium]|nr:LLM class F420-dependent oxidoreductase [Jiangellaceae bacterium]